MIKCDVDGCDWEGYKIGLHKSLKHGITRKSQVHFDALINTIKESEDSLTVEEIGHIFNLLKTILKKRYERIQHERNEQDKLYRDVMKKLNDK
jgi:Zn-dependent M32 family carboxypeptidase